jgi:threonyl-tRNA synthetase
VKLVDAIGRPWQLTTVQFDFNLPARFKLEYVGEDGSRHQPLMVHRALFGSIERFFGVLIEHYAGAFPAWLAPVQATVLPVSGKFIDYAQQVTQKLKDAGFRAHLDDRNEKLQAKIRDAQLEKIPYMLIIGGKEAEAGHRRRTPPLEGATWARAPTRPIRRRPRAAEINSRKSSSPGFESPRNLLPSVLAANTSRFQRKTPLEEASKLRASISAAP